MARQRSHRAPSPGRVLAALDRIRADVDALRLIVAGEVSTPIVPAVPMAVVDNGPEWISPGEAAAIRDCSKRTIVTLARKHGFGAQSGGRWQIDRRRFLEFQSGGRG